MTLSHASTLAEVQELERENTRLKGIIGEHHRQVLTDLRAITLRRENQVLSEIADAIKKVGQR